MNGTAELVVVACQTLDRFVSGARFELDSATDKEMGNACWSRDELDYWRELCPKHTPS